MMQNQPGGKFGRHDYKYVEATISDCGDRADNGAVYHNSETDVTSGLQDGDKENE